VVGADIRRGEWGSKFPADLVRDFILSSLRHPAAADIVSEYVFDIATSGEKPPADIGDALQVALREVLSAATTEDWQRVGRDLLADTHDCIGDNPLPAPPPEESMAAWSPVAGSSRRPRKPLVMVRQQAILDWLTEVGSATPREIAEHFGNSQHSARRKADGLAAQGKLLVTEGAFAKDDRPVIARRYTLPQLSSTGTEGSDKGLSAAPKREPQGRPELSRGSS
jgi:hypothetical protein